MVIPGKPVVKKTTSIDDLIEQQAEQREKATSPPKKVRSPAKPKIQKSKKQKPIEAAPVPEAQQTLGRPRSVGGKGAQFYLPDQLRARLDVVARELCAGNASYYVRKVLEKALDEDEAKIKKLKGR